VPELACGTVLHSDDNSGVSVQDEGAFSRSPESGIWHDPNLSIKWPDVRKAWETGEWSWVTFVFVKQQ
jgi:hypothetical protein